MTTALTTSTRPDTRAVLPVGITVGVVAGGLPFLFAHDWGEIAVVVAVVVITTVGIFGFVVPRALRKDYAGGTSLGLSIPAALLVLPAFWSGLPLVLGVAGLIVGNAGRNNRAGAGQAVAGMVIGALAVLAYLAIHIMEGFAGNTGFLLA